jgi:predicted dehydrogenase
MKILICGVGSVGERHIRNLLSIGYNDIILYRKRGLPLRTIKKKLLMYDNLTDALNQKPDVAFICNPTHLHMKTALECANFNTNIFIEKPVSHNLEFQHQLSEVLENNKKIAMVGYMMRYHPCIIKIREWIDKGEIGNVVSFRSIWGEYLPDWHPWEDYRETYASLREMGGGPALTLSHELDLAVWLFGEVEKVSSMKNYNSDLEINTEHGIDILIRFVNSVTANIHLDYISKPPKRETEIVGTLGRIEFDYYKNEALLYCSNSKKIKKTYSTDNNFDRNNMFIAEIKDFMRSISASSHSPIGLEESFRSVNIALEALKED